MPGGCRGQLSGGRPSQKQAPASVIRERREGAKNEPSLNEKRAAKTVLPTNGGKSCRNKVAEATRRPVMESTAVLTCVPATGARPRDQKPDVVPPASRA